MTINSLVVKEQIKKISIGYSFLLVHKLKKYIKGCCKYYGHRRINYNSHNESCISLLNTKNKYNFIIIHTNTKLL